METWMIRLLLMILKIVALQLKLVQMKQNSMGVNQVLQHWMTLLMRRQMNSQLKIKTKGILLKATKWKMIGCATQAACMVERKVLV